MNEVWYADKELRELLELVPVPDIHDRQDTDVVFGDREWVITKGPMEVRGSKKHVRVTRYLDHFSDRRLIVEAHFKSDIGMITSSIICRKGILADTDYGEHILEEDTKELLKDVVRFAINFYEDNKEETRKAIQQVSAKAASKVRKLLSL